MTKVMLGIGLLLAACVPIMHAQLRSSTVAGSVLDEKGSVVPGVEVKLTDEGTNVTSTAKTNESGFPLSISGASDGSINGYPDRLTGVPVEVPKEFQHWYDGRTPVTLPCSNAVPRTLTPAANTFLKFNTCAFSGHHVALPNGTYRADQYWWGTSANNFVDIRTSPWFNMDLTVRRQFKITERYLLDLSANAANVLNHTEMRGSASLGLGATQTADSLATGLYKGMGSSSGYGAYGTATFSPRQVTMSLRLRF